MILIGTRWNQTGLSFFLLKIHAQHGYYFPLVSLELQHIDSAWACVCASRFKWPSDSHLQGLDEGQCMSTHTRDTHD